MIKIFTVNFHSSFKINILNHLVISCRYYKILKYDVTVIGGGIIGSSIAKKIKENIPQVKICLLEKENELAQHQSSHNSQVIHAGIYYKPNSLKAKFCVKGSQLIYDYCETNNIKVNKCGKLIIGNDTLDKYRLNELYNRGLTNNVRGLELLTDWRDIQPFCKGTQALWSPETGTIDWKIVTKCFGKDFKRCGGHVFFNCEMTGIRESSDASYPIMIEEKTCTKIFYTKYLIFCLGLYTKSFFKVQKETSKNISLRVNYSLLKPQLNRFVKTNIYAMPHLDLPFIGIHFTPTVNGQILLGPSAVPSLKLDGYKQTSFDWNYVQNNVFSKNVGLLFLKNSRSCFNQMLESFSTNIRTSVLKKYFPMISKHDVLPGPVGLQGQIVTEDGEFFDDFVIEMFKGEGIQKRIINCEFLPSPGATACLAVAEQVSGELEKHLHIE